ncbi:MAG: uncharacterized protein QG604_491 [Candidatus Dependentiae bacterium]|nr:uncharacterized protein [Candidatus Dependentiae bacterium]
MYKKRLLEAKILSAARRAKVILLVGARKVGKSTLLKNLFPNLPIVTFNPIQDVQNARKDPELFLSQFSGPVILLESTYFRESTLV